MVKTQQMDACNVAWKKNDTVDHCNASSLVLTQIIMIVGQILSATSSGFSPRISVSESRWSNCGVPQVSQLGPVLFMLYMFPLRSLCPITYTFLLLLFWIWGKEALRSTKLCVHRGRMVRKQLPAVKLNEDTDTDDKMIQIKGPFTIRNLGVLFDKSVSLHHISSGLDFCKSFCICSLNKH